MNSQIYMDGTNLAGSEALLKMSDDWIDSGSCSHKTVIDLRDYAKELQSIIENGKRDIIQEMGTPRTDSECGYNINGDKVCPVEFAKYLERENQQLRDGLRVCKEALKSCKWVMVEPNRSMKHYNEEQVKNALSNPSIQSLKDQTK